MVDAFTSPNDFSATMDRTIDLEEQGVQKLLEQGDGNHPSGYGIAFDAQVERPKDPTTNKDFRLILVSGWIPWAGFTAFMVYMSLGMRSDLGAVGDGLAQLFIFGGITGLLIHNYVKRPRRRALMLWLVTSIFMVVGYTCGKSLYEDYSKQLFMYDRLKWNETPISPKLTGGDIALDAGVMLFSKDSYLDRAHGGCYRAHETYCVAPIVERDPGSDLVNAAGVAPSLHGAYDFFAVGKECCGCPEAENFDCGSTNLPAVYAGGLRVLEEEDRVAYNLAVKQWEARYMLESKKPVFVYWEADPLQKLKGMQEAVFNNLFVAIAMSLGASYMISGLLHFVGFM